MTTSDEPHSSRIRVLFVIGTMGGGGAERQIIEILKRLDRTRFVPMLYLAMKQGELLSEVPSDVPILAFWDGTPETRPRQFLRIIRLTRIARYVHLARILYEQKIDVVYDRTYLATLDAAGGCLLRPTPRISCCVVDPQPELELHSRFSTALSWWFARRAYKSASIVLANSNGLRTRVIDYFRLSPDHVSVIYNLLANVQSKVENPSGLRLGDESFLIVCSGRLHPQKGQIFLLKAIDDIVNNRGRTVKLLIFGNGESESELREFIQSHHLESCVTLAGFVNDVHRWYQRANLFVLPSLYEGMPNALIEAVACGVPALSTDCPSGPREILDDGRCGRIVPPADASALADAIIDAIDHSDEWRSRADVARKRVAELFDPEIGIRRLEELLEQTARRATICPCN